MSDRPATIYDIARKAEVSIATVSRVLNDHPKVAAVTRERVLAVTRELAYHPNSSARSLASRRASLVAAVIPIMTNHFFIEVLRGVQDSLAACQYDLLVYSARTQAEMDGQLDRAMRRGRSAGVMLFSSHARPERVARLQASGVPVVLVDVFHRDLDSVWVDNEHGGYLAARHLASRGYRSVGLVMAHPRTGPAADRSVGFDRAVAEFGLAVPDGWRVVCEDETDGYSETAGHRAVADVLARAQARGDVRDGLPEALVATSDAQAVGVMRAFREAGLTIPEDVALVGYDDLPMVEFLGLTTLRQPMYELGQTATHKLLERIRQPDEPISHTVYYPKLVVRETTPECAV